MKKITFKLNWYLFICLPVIISSCSSIKNVKYFKDIPDSAAVTRLAQVKYSEPKILPDDILSINIQTADPEATKILQSGNLQNSTVGVASIGTTGSQSVSGYLVDSKGNVELPVLGKIMVGGLTTEQAREVIRLRAAELYKNPSVNLRFANFKITVLGEVAKPGTYVVSNERINILDALGLAGDLTIYGKRDNISLIRQSENGTRVLVKVDLTNSSVFNSPYYFLRQNDYIYVEPVKSKVVSSDTIQNRNVSIITAIAASLISIFTILISTNKL